jgi:hypothetical protein
MPIDQCTDSDRDCDRKRDEPYASLNRIDSISEPKEAGESTRFASLASSNILATLSSEYAECSVIST